MTAPMLTVEEVAEHLNVSTDTVYDLAQTGLLVGSRIGVKGGAWRFTEADVADYVKAAQPLPTVGIRKRRGRRTA